MTVKTEVKGLAPGYFVQKPKEIHKRKVRKTRGIGMFPCASILAAFPGRPADTTDTGKPYGMPG